MTGATEPRGSGRSGGSAAAGTRPAAMYSSSARGVGASKTALMSVSMPASRRRPISWIASNELPPSAKKFSSVPTSSRWRTSAIVAAIGPSAVEPPPRRVGGGRLSKSIFPRSVRGRASSTRITELGTM